MISGGSDPGTWLGREKPIDKPPRIGRIRQVVLEGPREAAVGDVYAACPVCGKFYNVTTRKCCPDCLK